MDPHERAEPHLQHLSLAAVSYRMAGSVCGLFEGTLYAFRELVPYSLASLRHLVNVS